jgi:predicted nucleic acid-binding protein
MSNQCRARGISGSAVDFLICAAAHRLKWAIFTTDLDFQRYASVLPLGLYRT